MILTLLMLALLVLAWFGTAVAPRFIAAWTNGRPAPQPAPQNDRLGATKRAQEQRFDARRARDQQASAEASPRSVRPATLAAAGALGLFGVSMLMADGGAGGAVSGFDEGIYATLRDMRSATFDRLMIGASGIGDQKVVVPVALAILAVCAAYRRWRAAIFFGLAIAGTAAFVGGGKMIWQRARPSSIYQGLTEFSFPSGHAAMGMALLGFLSLLIMQGAAGGSSNAWRRLAAFVCLAGVLIISFSRIYLGA